MAGQSEAGQGQGQGQGQGDGSDKPFNYRQLEESRDKFKSQAEKWRETALRRTAQQQGFDPDQGVGKLLLDSFVRDKGDELEPEKLDEAFQGYVEEVGIQGQSQGQGQGQGGEGQGQGQGGETTAEQVLDHKQSTGDQLRAMSQPNQGEKSLQQQIAEAEAAGDTQTAQNLNFQLAADQFVQNARG